MVHPANPSTPVAQAGNRMLHDGGTGLGVVSSHSDSIAAKTPSLICPASGEGVSEDSDSDDNLPGTPTDGSSYITNQSKYHGTTILGKHFPQTPKAYLSVSKSADSSPHLAGLIEGLRNSASRNSEQSATPTKGQNIPEKQFVVQARQIDDPFSAPPQGQTAAKHNRAPAQEIPAKVIGNGDDHQSFPPRQDRLSESPSVNNAQGIFPPDACVFVANLSSTHTDEELEAAVNDVFSQFGQVYTKVRRDHRDMPYAFCQYEIKTDADRAITEGKGEVILGRPVRTEIAKVQRAVYVSRHNGKPVHKDEVLAILKPFGPIEHVFYPTETERELYSLPSGLWVRFAFYNDSRDALNNLRDHSDFRFDQQKDSRHGSVNRSKLSPTSGTPGKPFDTTPAHDNSKTIFVGGLPRSVTQEILGKIFARYGHITSIHIVDRSTIDVEPATVYAYVEFTSPSSSCAAVSNENGVLFIHGYPIRVERKQQSTLNSHQSRARSPTALRDMYALAPTANQTPPMRLMAAPYPGFPPFYPHAFIHSHQPHATASPTALQAQGYPVPSTRMEFFGNFDAVAAQMSGQHPFMRDYGGLVTNSAIPLPYYLPHGHEHGIPPPSSISPINGAGHVSQGSPDLLHNGNVISDNHALKTDRRLADSATSSTMSNHATQMYAYNMQPNFDGTTRHTDPNIFVSQERPNGRDTNSSNTTLGANKD